MLSHATSKGNNYCLFALLSSVARIGDILSFGFARQCCLSLRVNCLCYLSDIGMLQFSTRTISNLLRGGATEPLRCNCQFSAPQEKVSVLFLLNKALRDTPVRKWHMARSMGPEGWQTHNNVEFCMKGRTFLQIIFN